MGKKYHQKKVEEKIIHWAVIGIVAVSFLSAVWPFLLAAGVGYGVYRMATKQYRLEKSNTALRLQDLKDSIGRTDRQLKLLDGYLEEKNFNQYAVLSRQLLPQLTSIKEEADALKSKMDFNIYKRITTKVTQVTTDISAQLEKIGLTAVDGQLSEEEEMLMKLAPELLSCYRNIKMDDQVIRQKLKNSSNRAELTALHDANMNRFTDILQGYLKIKENPKDFHKATERLEQAKLALEAFDLQLDETLRELNENDLSDFEISLRMMNQKGE